MINDPDSPSSKEMEFAGHRKLMPEASDGLKMWRLEHENAKLRKELKQLEGKTGGHQNLVLPREHGAAGRRHAVRIEKKAALQGLSQRMDWAKEELSELRSSRRAVGRPQIRTSQLVDPPMPKQPIGDSAGPWSYTAHNGVPTTSLTTPAGDDNPIA